jgi:hypothetical protein
MSGKPNRDEIARRRNQILQTIMPSTSFRGSLASHIRECKTMGSLEDYDKQLAAITPDQEFPAFSDGYMTDDPSKQRRKGIFFDRNDEMALMDQSQLVRELELDERQERREQFHKRWELCHKAWLERRQHIEDEGRKRGNIAELARKHGSNLSSSSESHYTNSDSDSGEAEVIDTESYSENISDSIHTRKARRDVIPAVKKVRRGAFEDYLEAQVKQSELLLWQAKGLADSVNDCIVKVKLESGGLCLGQIIDVTACEPYPCRGTRGTLSVELNVQLLLRDARVIQCRLTDVLDTTLTKEDYQRTIEETAISGRMPDAKDVKRAREKLEKLRTAEDTPEEMRQRRFEMAIGRVSCPRSFLEQVLAEQKIILQKLESQGDGELMSSNVERQREKVRQIEKKLDGASALPPISARTRPPSMTNEEKMQARLEELQRKVKKGAKETKEPVGKKIDSVKGANDIIQGAMATLGLAGFGQGADSDDDL